MIVIDHNEPIWNARYLRRGRENGAATYSREIVQSHIPLLEHVFDGKDVVVSTCAIFTQIDSSLMPKNRVDIAVQYLHTYSYEKPLDQPREIKRLTDTFADRTLFITAYRQLAIEMQSAGFDAVFVPMSIDESKVLEAIDGAPENIHGVRHAIYFGNITNAKNDTFRILAQEFRRCGWKLDFISNGKLNGHTKISQEEAWRKIFEYEYAIGVGRCALEMMCMGKKTMIAGAAFGGLMIDESDWKAQHATNMNGRIITFNRDIATCLRLFDSSFIQSFDSRLGAECVAEAVHEWLETR